MRDFVADFENYYQVSRPRRICLMVLRQNIAASAEHVASTLTKNTLTGRGRFMDRHRGAARELDAALRPRGCVLRPQPWCATVNHSAMEETRCGAMARANDIAGSIGFLSQIRTQSFGRRSYLTIIPMNQKGTYMPNPFETPQSSGAPGAEGTMRLRRVGSFP